MKRPDQIQEEQIAERLRAIYAHGRRQPGSGNQAHSPNDVAIAHELHVEAKCTAAASMSVKYGWIANAVKRAMLFRSAAVVAIRFYKFDSHDYFLVRDEEFYEYLELKRNANNTSV